MCPPGETPGGSPTDCNFTSRGDKSLAYDWITRSGRVNDRVALLLRFIERQPVTAKIFRRESPETPPIDRWRPLYEGGRRGEPGEQPSREPREQRKGREGREGRGGGVRGGHLPSGRSPTGGGGGRRGVGKSERS